MNIGIVGSEGAKFTKLGEEQARKAIVDIIMNAAEATNEIPTIVSGECHLGGIDIYAKDEALKANVGYKGFPPKKLNWSEGYKPRNIQIYTNSDIVYCITPDVLPEGYSGMRFKTCYHCARAGRSGTDHIKSGGCWTVIEGMKHGKEGKWITVSNL